MSLEEENQELEGEVGTLSQDRADLHRGVILNTIGSVIKLGHPVLMGIAIWLYGEVIWGIFVTAQAALLPLGRLCMLGLDKGLLWWVPRQKPKEERRSILPSLVLIVGLTSIAAVLISAFLRPGLLIGRIYPRQNPTFGG